jgi:hypothetical protein
MSRAHIGNWMLVSLLTVHFGCKPAAPATGTDSANDPVQVAQVQVWREGTHAKVSLQLKVKNRSAEPVAISSETVSVKSGATIWSEFTRPFQTTVTIPPGESEAGEMIYWVPVAALSEPWKITWTKENMLLTSKHGIHTDQLPEGQSVVLSWPDLKPR